MNRKREPYDRLMVGERIRQKRTTLGLTQEELSEKIDRAPTYCSDIERGICGMSLETMIAISKSLDISIDYLLFGKTTEDELERNSDSQLAIIHMISQYPENKRTQALRLLELFLAAVDNK